MGDAATPAGRRFLGFIALESGIGGRSAWVALYAALISIGILNFLHFARPFLLLHVLQLPQSAIGRISGFVATGTEMLAMVVTLAVGAWADRIGRRALYASALTLVGAGYLGLVFLRGFPDYVLYITVMSIGSAMIGTMLGLIIVDYPKDASRGKWAGLCAVANGIGIVIVALGVTKLPAWLEGRGLPDTVAMQWTLGLMACWCVASALLLRAGLITGLAAGATKAREPMLTMLRDGLAVAARNPSVLLCYLCFVVSRADLVVVAMYLTLWVQDFAHTQGLSPTDAVARSGVLFALTQGTALFWGPVFGFLLDRLNRVFCVVIALALAGVAYIALGLTPDPLANSTYALCAAVGIGQISMILATQSLIGKEAPVARRGTVMGIATFFGTVGLLVTSFVGGLLYDLWMASAPLVVFGGLNLLVLIVALWVWRGAGMPVR